MKKPAGARRSQGPDPLVGRVINDRFRILALLARGGMGKVYRAEQAPLGREVALKILNPNYHGDNDPEFHKRFFLEASISSKLTHPNTVTIFDYGRTDDEIYYIAMELLEGRTLHHALRDEQRLPPERALHIARQMCRSLREAHSLGVIHRDLKPANIFLVQHGDETDFVKVLDFGLVKDIGDTGEDLTQTGLFMGSPKYMSPEQISGGELDARADIYSLGIILYEMLTGSVPFDRPNSVNILMAHVHEAPPPMNETAADANIDPAIEQMVMRCLAKEANQRFASMDALLAALKHVSSSAGLAVSHSGEFINEFMVAGGSTGAFGAVADRESLAPSGPSANSVVPPIAITDPSLAAAVNPRQSKANVVVVVTLLIAAGLGAFFALRTRSIETPVETQPQNEMPDETPPQETVETAPATRVMVTLHSEPSGASVVVGERTYGPTPAVVEWTGQDAEPGREVTFRFQLDGHRDFSVTRTVAGDSLEVNAQLEPSRAPTPMVRRPPRPRTPMMTTMHEGPAIGLEGYKAEPY